MNFKEAYKAANDEIHGDKSLLAGISEKQTKKPIIYFKPAAVCAAAAAIALATWVSYPYLSGNTPTGQKETTLSSSQTGGMKVTDENLITYKTAEDMAQPLTGEADNEKSQAVTSSAEKRISNEKQTSPAEQSAQTRSAPDSPEPAYDEKAELTEEAFAPKMARMMPEMAEAEADEASGSREEAAYETAQAENGVSDTFALDAGVPEDVSVAAGGGSETELATYTAEVTAVNSDYTGITVKLPENREVNITLTENTAVTNTYGEAVTAREITVGDTAEIICKADTFEAVEIKIIK